MRPSSIVALLVWLCVLSTACAAEASPRERVVGGPCGDCADALVGMPRRLGWDARIAPASEPGEPLILEGVVKDAAGAPAAGVIIYAYHTDAKGEYPRHPRFAHGRLRGFARTDARGRYRFTTIRPARYPGTGAPQHVHVHVIEPGRCTYVIDEVLFTDDPVMTPERQAEHARGRGGSGIVTPTRADASAPWRARRDITLGAGIDDHARCATP